MPRPLNLQPKAAILSVNLNNPSKVFQPIIDFSMKLECWWLKKRVSLASYSLGNCRGRNIYSACGNRGRPPPGIVIVPIAAAIWLAGHGLLWVSHKLAIRGKHLADNRNIASGKWPLAIVVLVFITGIVFIFGLFGIVWQVLPERNWLRKLPIPFAVWIPSS